VPTVGCILAIAGEDLLEQLVLSGAPFCGRCITIAGRAP
jgi:hypothetical protein